MSKIQEKIIKDAMVEGYLKAMGIAEESGVPPQDFQLWASQTLLGLFLSINEISSNDSVPEEIRLQIFQSSVDGFRAHALEMFQEFLKTNRKPLILSP